MRKIAVVFLVSLFFVACGEYQKVLKQEKVKPKYDLAIKLYDQGMETGKKKNFKRSIRLLEQILPKYRGKPQGEKISFVHADAYYQLEDYFNAGYQFERFTKSYPESSKLEEAYYKGARSYASVSPRFSLDQTETQKGINKLQEYITRYPDGEHIGDANELVSGLREKLEKKAFKIAKGYHHREDYKASVAAMGNFIDEYPGSVYSERAYFYKMDSEYLLAINSYRQLVRERLEKAKKYYEEYKKYYPDGDLSDQAQLIFQDISERLEENFKS